MSMTRAQPRDALSWQASDSWEGRAQLPPLGKHLVVGRVGLNSNNDAPHNARLLNQTCSRFINSNDLFLKWGLRCREGDCSRMKG